MENAATTRLLSIGEFAAATQLSPKALRLYDEQGILRPAVVDATNGYRYYGREQIALGRLIRTLRDMNLPLTGVAAVVAADGPRAETLLRQFALEGEHRFAREKRAFHAAMALVRHGASAAAPTITKRTRSTITIAVQPFLAERRSLLERFRGEVTASRNAIAAAGLIPAGEPFCLLIDPPSEEEGRLEAAIPLTVPAAMPHGVTIRQLPAATCAVLVFDAIDINASDLTGALDALFDWFDRHGCRATEPPAVAFVAGDSGARTEISWAYEAVVPVSSAR